MEVSGCWVLFPMMAAVVGRSSDGAGVGRRGSRLSGWPLPQATLREEPPAQQRGEGAAELPRDASVSSRYYRPV